MATKIEFDRQAVAEKDAQSILRLIDSAICSMDYAGFGNSRSGWGLSYLTGVLMSGLTVFRNDGFGQFLAQRTRRHIIHDASRNFIVSIPLLQRTVNSQAGSTTTCDPGTFRLISTSVPFSCAGSAPTPNGNRSELFALIPGAVLRQLVPEIDRFTNVPISIHAGAGRIMKSMLELALLEGGSISCAQDRDLSNSIVRSVATAVSESPEWKACNGKPVWSSLIRVAEEAKEFVKLNLANPRLGSKLVAAHCQVSERYLHRAFAANSMTVGPFIREMRLEECRKAILNPALRNRSIADIAQDWGFSDPASFNRTYKARYGTTAGRERERISELVH